MPIVCSLSRGSEGLMLTVSISLLLLLTFIAIARTSHSAKNHQGTVFNKVEISNTLSLEKNELIVSTFNIQGGKDLSGKRNIMRSAQAIESADLIGLQEIYAPGYLNKLGIGKSQTQIMAQKSGFAWLFCATRTRWFREFRGNAVLSKLPVSNWRVEMLPNKIGKNFRNMVVVELSWKGQTLHFINTHLHTREGKQAQFNTAFNEFMKHPRAILVGDFNSRPSEEHIQKALKNQIVEDAISKLNLDSDEKNRIDWILTKGFNINDGKMIEKGISDHPYYQISLSLPS